MKKAEWPDSESSKVLRESRKVPQKYYLFSPSNEKYYKWYYTQKLFNTEKKWVCWTLQVKYTTFWSVNDLRYTIYSPLKLTFSRYSGSRGVKCSVKWSKGVERCTGNTNKQSTSTWPESCSLLDGQISYSHHSQQTARFHPVITGRVWFHPAMTVQPDFLRSFVSI